MGRVLGLAELGNKVELDQLGLALWLKWSLKDFPEWGGGVVGSGGSGWENLGIKLKLSFSWGLGSAEQQAVTITSKLTIKIIGKFFWKN